MDKNPPPGRNHRAPLLVPTQKQEAIYSEPTTSSEQQRGLRPITRSSFMPVSESRGQADLCRTEAASSSSYYQRKNPSAGEDKLCQTNQLSELLKQCLAAAAANNHAGEPYWPPHQYDNYPGPPLPSNHVDNLLPQLHRLFSQIPHYGHYPAPNYNYADQIKIEEPVQKLENEEASVQIQQQTGTHRPIPFSHYEHEGHGLGRQNPRFRHDLSHLRILQQARYCPDQLPTGKISPEERRKKIALYLEKRKKRTYTKKIAYDCRKKVADQRIRVKGRFVTKDQALELLCVEDKGYTADDIKKMLVQRAKEERKGDSGDQ